jgi:hypothetical protein
LTGDEQLTAAHAGAFRQRVPSTPMFDVIVQTARGLVAEHGATGAWSLLARDIQNRRVLKLFNQQARRRDARRAGCPPRRRSAILNVPSNMSSTVGGSL